MSDNKNGKRRPDSFAVPGDENIVSNKGFLISLPKFRKSSANPLLESEKNKQNKQQEKKEERHREDKGSRPNNHKKNNKNNNNRNHNNNNVNGAKDRPERKEAQEPRGGQNAAPDRQKNKGFDKKRREQDRRQRDNQKRDNGQKEAAKEKNIPAADNKKPQFDKRNKHKKHKKEKFVPTAADGKEGELLQPIVDRTEFLSGTSARKNSLFGTSALSGLSDKGFSKKPDTKEDNAPEIRYVDENRTLREQIEEEEAKRNAVTAPLAEGVEVIGVRFREAGKIYYFAPGEKKVKAGQAVIVETARGVEYGFCAIGNRFVSEDKIVPPLKSIIRIATEQDTERYNGNKLLEESAAKLFREKVKKLGLEMSLVYVEYTFDNGKILFYFTAEGRVDFRELIKELASAFKTRIELRQIGVRDEAKIVGGLGICGRPVCCKSFLGEFSQVSIKMAKDQNLFINSSKISGTCGRFMCCIRYEDETYQKEYEKTPKVNAIVETPDGRGVVVESNALSGNVKVLLDDKPDSLAAQYKCADIKLIGYLKKDNEKEIEVDETLLGD